MRAQMVAVLLAVAPVPGAAESFDCLMDPPATVKLGSAVDGLLDEVSVRRGDLVEKGQVVARVDSTVERAAREVLALRAENTARIDGQKARLELIESRKARTEELLSRGVATEDAMQEIYAEEVAGRSQLREAEMDLELARRELARADAMLGLHDIRSPLTGIVQERNLSAGELVHRDTYVATLVQLDPLYVETFLPVERFRDVAEGDIAIVRPAPPVEGSFEARVEVVDRVFDPASGTFGVRLLLPNPGGALPGGYRCKVDFAFGAGN